MNNQTILSVSTPTSIDDRVTRCSLEVRRTQTHQLDADEIFVPELGGNLKIHLQRITKTLNVPRRLSDWLASVVSGAVSGL
ncbi:MAG: hypothetical protein AAF629_22995 [Chloroflexota bacterium]